MEISFTELAMNLGVMFDTVGAIHGLIVLVKHMSPLQVRLRTKVIEDLHGWVDDLDKRSKGLVSLFPVLESRGIKIPVPAMQKDVIDGVERLKDAIERSDWDKAERTIGELSGMLTGIVINAVKT